MRPALGLLAISLLAVPVYAETKAPAGGAAPAALSERAALLAPIQVDSLTLTPIVAVQAAIAIAPGAPATKLPDMLVLDEAMANKQVKISEQDAQSVNNLTLTNTADRPVFILAGEVIIGGKQDRIIGANTIIPPKTTLSVPVFCVEHGRWDNSSTSFTTAKALAHGRLRGKASFEAQGDVWKEVATKNVERKTSNSTDTYRTVAKQQSDGTLKTWEKKVTDALAKVPAADRDRMIGYVIALDGKVATVDMFQSPALFKKLEGKLLKSYMTEAVDVPATKDAKPPSPADVKTFMADADKAASQRSYETKAAKTKIQKGVRANKSTVDFDAGTVEGASRPKMDPAPAYESYHAH